MGTTFLMAFALMLIIEGVLPFLLPTLWRDTFRRITEFTDGQIRFFGLSSMLVGLLILFCRRWAVRVLPDAQLATPGKFRGPPAASGAAHRADAREAARTVPRARVPAGDSPHARVPRIAADGHGT